MLSNQTEREANAISFSARAVMNGMEQLKGEQRAVSIKHLLL
jgi:hypothetical protein